MVDREVVQLVVVFCRGNISHTSCEMALGEDVWCSTNSLSTATDLQGFL